MSFGRLVGAMGILLVYDVFEEDSFKNIKNWILNIRQHAAENVQLVLVGHLVTKDDDSSEIAPIVTDCGNCDRLIIRWRRFKSPPSEAARLLMYMAFRTLWCAPKPT